MAPPSGDVQPPLFREVRPGGNLSVQPNSSIGKSTGIDERETNGLAAIADSWAISKDETAGSNLDREHLTAIDDLQGKPDLTEAPEMPIRERITVVRRGSRTTTRPPYRSIRNDRPPRPSIADYDSYEDFSPVVSEGMSDSESSSGDSFALKNSTSRRKRHRKDEVRDEPRALVRRAKKARTVENLLEELDELHQENERLKGGVGERAPTPPPAAPTYTYQIFHCIDDSTYLDEPQWVAGERGPQLHARNPVRKVDYYLDQHPEIAFVFYKDYKSEAPADRSKLETKDGVFRAPVPVRQSLSLISSSMRDAVERLVQSVPDFGEYFPHFDAAREIATPYLFMYYSIPYIPDILPDLDPLSRSLVEKLQKSIEDSHGYEYTSANLQFRKGLVARHLVKYLIRPGDVLVSPKGPSTQAYIALDWPTEREPPIDGHPEDYEEYDRYRRRKMPRWRPEARPSGGRKFLRYEWMIPVWHWRFDGDFEMTQTQLTLRMKSTYEEEAVNINELNILPLEHGPRRWRKQLETRGEMFWKLRFKKFVSYSGHARGELNNIDERYMVDIYTYKALHPNSLVARSKLRPELDTKEMTSDQPPPGNTLLLFPPTIPGYNLLRKKWVDLYVDQISDIVWNKQAFKDLVVDEETKELVQALVMKQLVAEKSTDLISGKGNGLVILLHGAPGTGKTFTAEGVAEFAEKPLFRVTCSDVGTGADIVEKRLESSFHLGKIWDCVVLLDEADVFLEERDMKDLNRNALVSVFLRALEYYDGILILTSNRVGTFDEAFKSRIQLALHYENLNISQRRKIWRNFMNRLKTLDELNIDFEDVNDHIDDLSQQDMNGREIRNAITTARQLAQFKGKPFCYSHLKQVIRVSSKFGKYLNDLRDGLTDDELKRESGLRLSYVKTNKSQDREDG